MQVHGKTQDLQYTKIKQNEVCFPEHLDLSSHWNIQVLHFYLIQDLTSQRLLITKGKQIVLNSKSKIISNIQTAWKKKKPTMANTKQKR